MKHLRVLPTRVGMVRIDDVRIYQRPLSPAEVQELYQVEAGADRYLSGSWTESKTALGDERAAGEIRIWLYRDGVCRAEREFNNATFDSCAGSWSQKTNSTGQVLSTKITFISDHTGEVFISTTKNNLVSGRFIGGGHVGKFQATFLPAAQDPHK